MVFSLIDLSLLSISNGIKDGTIQYLHLHVLPPEIRQQVLDMVLKRGFVDDPKCLALLSTVEFLNGMTSISTEAGRIFDIKLLQRLKNSMASVLSTGETVGAAITKMYVSVYGRSCFLGAYTENERRMKKSSLPVVSQLIAQCPFTTSLAFRGVESDEPLKQSRINGQFHARWFPRLLNQSDEMRACKRVMENLINLSIYDWTNVLGSQRPVIKFNRLTTLILDGCVVQVDQWPKLMQQVPTLEKLHMIDVNGVGKEDEDGEYAQADSKRLDWILPLPMPNLKSLEVVSFKDRDLYECNDVFIENLKECPELREVHLMLDEKSTDEASLWFLASMDITLKIKTRFIVDGIDEAQNAIFDSSSGFKGVRIFHDRMDSFELFVTEEWDPQYSTALEDVVDTCSNLTTFRINLPREAGYGEAQYEIESKEELKKVTAALVKFFGKSDRVQLEDLRLVGKFEEAVVAAALESSLNLVRLEISKCPALRDEHLIDWVSRGGGKLTDLIIDGCETVTNEGIIPILAMSAEKLLRIKVNPRQGDGGRNWEGVFNNQCPYAEFVDD